MQIACFAKLEMALVVKLFKKFNILSKTSQNNSFVDKFEKHILISLLEW